MLSLRLIVSSVLRRRQVHAANPSVFENIITAHVEQVTPCLAFASFLPPCLLFASLPRSLPRSLPCSLPCSLQVTPCR